ncbi:molybdopterin-dependent oxidoreductase [Paraburkholderia sp. MMS20-SJTN17]|uniref:Molybdopterin-dependent oxidoreductase n=1 Tax=Paraburkholderia translucens TaxID=2886945 RepID=A0ABS8KJ14_9BURK|nr:molybdopterin-dependent oxidoreductase [Paraburkholderia sp. MMS20-SJTN17]MCC8404414.1 molybdopterin-dependent oxidoreductase [Paraburkholderia sp. MMS20-SJTN17]
MANVNATLRNATGATSVRWRTRWLKGLTGLIVGLTVCCAYAQPAGQQSPALSLDVQGKIANTNDAAHRAYHFSESQLLALPVHAITTSTTWTPRSTFTGPRLADILKIVGSYGTKIEFHTFDDYTYTVPVADCARYGVIVAYSMNGQRLKLSDFGPLFLIYPRDAFPDELTGAAGDSKFVWQIKALIVK